MKKVYLLEVRQHHTKRYVGTVDARALVRLACKAELKETQEAQRPINGKRLEEISKFVAEEDGMLSTSVVIGTCEHKITVHPADVEDIPCLFYMDFPETEAEFEKFENAFNIMDGQHRLFSFLEDYNKLADNEPFDITFEMYLDPGLRLRRLIFKNTNEKQEKVASNLLMWFRDKLNMLEPKEKKYHYVVSELGGEDEDHKYNSPLKGRIIMGSERITGGLKAEQIITILDKSDIQYMGGMSVNAFDNDKMIRTISNYLRGWEIAVGAKIANRDKSLGAFSKISGFRFMILMLPTFYGEALKEHQRIVPQYIAEKIRELFTSQGMQPRDIFDKSSDYIMGRNDNPFASETTTTSFAKYWITQLKSLKSETFDPCADI